MTSKRALRVGLLLLITGAACYNELPGEFDPFEVTVNVLGAGNGNGRVTEIETELDINCHIVAGEPNDLSEVNRTNRCQGSFIDLNGLGTFQLNATPDDGHEFVGWTGDCLSVQGTICQLEFVSRVAVTLTVRAEFRPLGLIIAAPSDTFRPHGAVAKW